MADITTWTPISAPTDFQDDAVFNIDFKTKTVQVLVEQPIVAGENLSQFIKFQAPRFYDNIDLTEMMVNILYVSPAGNKGISEAVNTEYSDDFIRCGWLVPYAACPEKGTLLFVLEFVGTDYVLKTTIGSTPVLDSINDADVIPEPVEQAWYITLQANVSAALQEAQTALGRIESIFNALSAPMSASTAVEMADETAIYVYTGSETGYTYGDWYYYDGTAWTSGGTYASTALVTDPTLSQSGQAADAKVVGDKIGGFDNQLRDNHLAKRIVENSYVKNNGQFSNYSGWNRTDYIRVDYIDTLKVTATASSNYNVFYDENKVKIPTYNSASATAVISIVSGENEVKVPPNAKYVMFSGTAEMINTLIVEPLKTRSEYADEAVVAFVQENVYGKQNLVFAYNDIAIGTLNAETGAEEDHAYSMRSGYIPIINTQNTHSIVCEGFKFYVYEYSYNGSTYEFVGRTANVVHNFGKWTGSRKTTHIRIWAQTTNSNNITSGIIDSFVKAFKMSEIRDINKYLRVCTFNQAANTDPYMSASEEDTKKRALNHLNFLGEYNPDIICAQEALGNYFQPVAYEISVGNVYDRKYFYMHNPGYQRRTWSKYNMSQLAKVDFVSQASGDNRFYGKCLIAFEGIDIWLINTHCAFQGNDDFELARKGQFEELIAEMQQHEYCILCGDFNAWSADEFSLFTDAGFNIANCGDFGELITWDPHHASQTWPFGAFDNIITTPNIYIQNVKLGPYDFNLFSDHIPLIADLQIR